MREGLESQMRWSRLGGLGLRGLGGRYLGFLLSPFVLLIIFSLCICPCSDVIKPVGVQTLATPLLCEENTIFLTVLLHLMLLVAWFPKAMRLL